MDDMVENVVEEVVETAKRVSLWDKRADELTVGESVKLSLAVPAVMIGGMLVIKGGIVAKDAIKARLEKRRHDKMEKELHKMAKVTN